MRTDNFLNHTPYRPAPSLSLRLHSTGHQDFAAISPDFTHCENQVTQPNFNCRKEDAVLSHCPFGA